MIAASAVAALGLDVRIVVTRHGFEKGERKYFAYPPPGVIGGLPQSYPSSHEAECPTF